MHPLSLAEGVRATRQAATPGRDRPEPFPQFLSLIFNDAKAGSVMSPEAVEGEFELQEQRSLSSEVWRGVFLAFVIMVASIGAIVAGIQLLHSFRF
jgi:hypothetical protein